jgi:hypothetical protein
VEISVLGGKFRARGLTLTYSVLLFTTFKADEVIVVADRFAFYLVTLLTAS